MDLQNCKCVSNYKRSGVYFIVMGNCRSRCCSKKLKRESGSKYF